MTRVSDVIAKGRFERDGFVKVSGLVTKAQLQALRRAVDRQMDELDQTPTSYDFQALSDYAFSGSDDALGRDEERLDLQMYKAVIRADPDARALDEASSNSPKGRFGFNAGGWVSSPAIREAALGSGVAALARELLGCSSLRLWEDTTFVKEAGATVRSAFHQDKHFARFEGNQDIVAWIALDEASEERGALEYVRGSHLWNTAFAPNMFFAQTILPGAPAPKLPDIETNRDDFDIVRVDAQPGDVIFHHGLTVHGACGNPSAHKRRAISFRYVGPDCRYKERPGSLPQSWVSHSLSEGDRLACDDYPVAAEEVSGAALEWAMAE